MIVLRNIAKLYDGASDRPGSVHEGVDLHLDGERIAKLVPHDPGLAAGDGLTFVDAAGWFVAPGLIDCHGHVTALGISEAAFGRMDGPHGMLLVEKILWRTLVDGGVTTLRDVGGATHAMKRAVDEGLIIGPTLKIAICMLSTTGGHADFRSPDRCHATLSALWPPAPGRPSSIVDGPWECRNRVREIAASGADLIKLCTSPGVASPSDRLEHRDFTAKEIRAITDEANARGLRVAAHAHSRSGIELAIENGVNDIQHISFMDERLAERAFEMDCTVTPTSWVIADLSMDDDLSDFVKEKAMKVREVHQTAVAHAASGGLRILGGTDAVLPGMHGRNWMELVHLVADGLTPLRAWHGMTGLAAAEIGRDDAGEIREGKRADLLILEQDAIEDPRRFEEGALLEVVKDGKGHRGAVPEIPQRRFDDTVRDAIG